MSVHGTCFDNGMSGNCNETCQDFLDGLCNEGANIIDELSDIKINYLYEDQEEMFKAICMILLYPDLDKRQELKRILGYE